MFKVYDNFSGFFLNEFEGDEADFETDDINEAIEFAKENAQEPVIVDTDKFIANKFDKIISSFDEIINSAEVALTDEELDVWDEVQADISILSKIFKI